MTVKNKKQNGRYCREIARDEIDKEDRDLARKWKRDLCHSDLEQTESKALRRLFNNQSTT
jgi:hypothetical protein